MVADRAQATVVTAETPGTAIGRVAPAVATIPVPIAEANQLGPITTRRPEFIGEASTCNQRDNPAAPERSNGSELSADMGRP